MAKIDAALPPGYITSNEAAGRFGINYAHVGYLCRLGKIRDTLSGRRWLVDEASLVAYVAVTEEGRARRAADLARERRAEYHTAQSRHVPEHTPPHLPKSVTHSRPPKRPKFVTLDATAALPYP